MKLMSVRNKGDGFTKKEAEKSSLDLSFLRSSSETCLTSGTGGVFLISCITDRTSPLVFNPQN